MTMTSVHDVDIIGLPDGGVLQELVSLAYDNFTNQVSMAGGDRPGNANDAEYGLSTRERMTLVAAPIFLIFGTAGNGLSGAVMLRKPFRRLSLGVYLLSLAFSDTATLFTNRLTRDWMKLVFGINLRTQSDFSCRVLVYLTYSCSSLSSWLVVAVSIDRLLVVCCPLHAKVMSTRHRASLVVAGITLGIFTLHAFIFHIVELNMYNNNLECMFVNKSILGVEPALLLEMLHLFLYSLVPAAILLYANISIIILLGQSGRFQRSSLVSSPSHSANFKRATWMLIVVSSSFIVLSTPLSLFLLLANLVLTKTEDFKELEVVLFTLKVSNHAVNFLLYAASGPSFRQELRYMCGCFRPATLCDSRAAVAETFV